MSIVAWIQGHNVTEYYSRCIHHIPLMLLHIQSSYNLYRMLKCFPLETNPRPNLQRCKLQTNANHQWRTAAAYLQSIQPNKFRDETMLHKMLLRVWMANAMANRFWWIIQCKFLLMMDGRVCIQYNANDIFNVHHSNWTWAKTLIFDDYAKDKLGSKFISKMRLDNKCTILFVKVFATPIALRKNRTKWRPNTILSKRYPFG